MNNNDILNKNMSQKCAGSGCNKKGIKKVRIIFVDKVGLFCYECADSLLELKIGNLE